MLMGAWLDVSHTLDGPFLKDTQQLDLKVHRHLSDLVKKERAAVRGFNLAKLVGGRPCKCTLSVPKQLGLQKVFGNRSAVDGNERTAASRGQPMNLAGDKLLPRTRFSEDQTRQICGADLLGDPIDTAHGPTGSDDSALACIICSSKCLVVESKLVQQEGMVDDRDLLGICVNP